jgi:transposase
LNKGKRPTRKINPVADGYNALLHQRRAFLDNVRRPLKQQCIIVQTLLGEQIVVASVACRHSRKRRRGRRIGGPFSNGVTLHPIQAQRPYGIGNGRCKLLGTGGVRRQQVVVKIT